MMLGKQWKPGKSTPPPWTAVPRDIGNDGTHDDDQAGLGWDLDGPPQAMLRGQFALAMDAKMAAASPELVNALERVLDEAGGCLCGTGGSIAENHSQTCQLAHAAVAKARGNRS